MNVRAQMAAESYRQSPQTAEGILAREFSTMSDQDKARLLGGDSAPPSPQGRTHPRLHPDAIQPQPQPQQQPAAAVEGPSVFRRALGLVSGVAVAAGIVYGAYKLRQWWGSSAAASADDVALVAEASEHYGKQFAAEYAEAARRATEAAASLQ